MLRPAFLAICLTFLAAFPARADLVTRLPTEEKVVALTFDACEQGRTGGFDRGILDLLVERQIPFTVFTSGKFLEANEAEVRTLGALGFVDIENHSWNHPNTMDKFTPEAVLDQVGRAHNAIVTATGRAPQFFRFPAGKYKEDGLKAVESLGYQVVHWRWASGDPDPRESANALYNRVVTKVQPGDILIFHINGRGVHTAEALPRIIDALTVQGYRFVLLSDYLGAPHLHEAPALSAELAKRKIDDLIERAPLSALMRALP